ncbi:MAG: cation:proton antiporter, partial [Hyphomicrobiaceae bacterium]
MAGVAEAANYKDALIVLATAAVAVPAFRRFKLSPVIAFLLAGVALGPNGIVQLAPNADYLQWITISPENQLGFAGELGVVFLLFLIGLELSFQRLLTMRRLVFGLGGAQIATAAIVVASIAWLLGLAPAAALVVGLSLALSSTAVVIELLSQQQRLPTISGRTSFAILLMQDLAVVPLILFVTILGGDSSVSIFEGLATALLQAVVALAAVSGIGWLALRPLFRHVASSGSQELFVAAILLVIVASGLVTGTAGLSMALGAFIAGLLLAETEFRRAVQAAVVPVKGLLLGVFFFHVGMGLDTQAIAAEPGTILMLSGLVIVTKILILSILLRAFGLDKAVTIQVSFLLASGGEFAFITVGLAATLGVIEPATATVVFAITSLSMLLIPALDFAGNALA